MKYVSVLAALSIAGCASSSAGQGTPDTTPPVEHERAASEVAEGSDADEAETNENEKADEIVECQLGGTVARPDATIQAGEYVNVQVGKPCDVLTIHAEHAHTIHESLRMADEARQRLGDDNVKLVIGRAATIYQSRNELLADAGTEAAAVVPKDFNFEAFAIARYELLHSRQVSCRDQRLGMTGKQAKAREASLEKFRMQAQELANQWQFVPDAVDAVGDLEVIDPVLPAERTYPVSGPCEVTWIEQPALTPVSRGTEVRIYYR